MGCIPRRYDKLDALMALSFSFLEQVGGCGAPVVRSVFDTLWKAFVRTVLHTFQSKHVQYVASAWLPKPNNLCERFKHTRIEEFVVFVDMRCKAVIVQCETHASPAGNKGRMLGKGEGGGAS
jgi:hypothetical protein